MFAVNSIANCELPKTIILIFEVKLADAHKIHPLSFIAVAFIVTKEWRVEKNMPK